MVFITHRPASPRASLWWTRRSDGDNREWQGGFCVDAALIFISAA